MDYRLDPLWLKLNLMNAQGLQDFAPIAQMLEQQTGVNAEMAQRIIEEYRKFLFLAMRAGHEVIPPGIVNEVWTAHMKNAQNYWKNLGKLITERPLAGGLDAKTMGTAGDSWSATLQSYEKIFGMKPPADIWGTGPAPENPWQQGMKNMRRMFGLE